MRNRIVLTLALCGLMVTMAEAQTPTAKGYLMGEVDVTDVAAYKAYADAVPGIVAKFGGKYLVRGGATTPVDGYKPFSRTVIIEFPSIAAAKAFEDSAEYQKVAAIRRKNATSHLFLVEGTQP